MHNFIHKNNKKVLILSLKQFHKTENILFRNIVRANVALFHINYVSQNLLEILKTLVQVEFNIYF